MIRDGGDPYGTSVLAQEAGAGVRYRLSYLCFCHTQGRTLWKYCGKKLYGFKEFHSLVLEAGRQGADFIKIMTTGLLDFADQGKVTGTPLDKKEVCEMVHIAHEEGLRL